MLMTNNQTWKCKKFKTIEYSQIEMKRRNFTSHEKRYQMARSYDNKFILGQNSCTLQQLIYRLVQ